MNISLFDYNIKIKWRVGPSSPYKILNNYLSPLPLFSPSALSVLPPGKWFQKLRYGKQH